MASHACFIAFATEGLKRGCASADETLALSLLCSMSISMTTSALGGFGVNVSDFVETLLSSICNMVDVA